jgi:hypothetical protein
VSPIDLIALVIAMFLITLIIVFVPKDKNSISGALIMFIIVILFGVIYFDPISGRPAIQKLKAGPFEVIAEGVNERIIRFSCPENFGENEICEVCSLFPREYQEQICRAHSELARIFSENQK